MGTLQTYLDHVSAVAAATAYVTFDKVSTLTNSEGTSDIVSLNVEPTADGAITTVAAANATTVLLMVPAVANTADGAKSATTAKRGWWVDQTTSGGQVQFTINGASVPATAYSLTGNPAVDALNIASTANKDLASAAGLILDAKVGAYSSGQVSLIMYPAGTQATSGERYTSAAVSSAATSTGNIWTVVEKMNLH